MIPTLSEVSPIQAKYLSFIEQLKAIGFSGDINLDYANRVVLSTDNSIYQILPQGVLYPKNTKDIQILTNLSNQAVFHDIVVSPRGGGTGTNGQSLTDGLIVDLSKYMNHILEINVEEGWVRVETGMAIEQLNCAVKSHGLFFPQPLTTSNGSTIGGMISDDASEQGSVMYGKTRDHVLSLKTVLLDGYLLESAPIDDHTLALIQSGGDYSAHAHRIVDSIQKNKAKEIKDTFPKLTQCLTGYDLAHIRTHDGRFDMNAVLCGSEGTLGFIIEAKINLLAIPTHAALVNIRYDSFEGALRHAGDLLSTQPTSIETIDSTVLNLAKADSVWHSVTEFFPTLAGEKYQGVNLIEFTGNNEQDVAEKIKLLTDNLDILLVQDERSALGYTIAMGREQVNKLSALRKKSARLLLDKHKTDINPEYTPAFLGDLYPSLQQIKGAFDPRNQLNPGKIATPFEFGANLIKTENVSLRKQFNHEISAKNRDYFKTALSDSNHDVMSTSWKNSRDRRYSPKGRAALIREWLRALSELGVDTKQASKSAKNSRALINFIPRIKNTLEKRRGVYDFSHEVHDAMTDGVTNTYCTEDYSSNIDETEYRAKFFELYYSRYLRPVKDYLKGFVEFSTPFIALLPKPYNWLISQRWINTLSNKYIGLINNPELSVLNLKKEMSRRGIRLATPLAIESLSPKDRSRAVIVVQDVFTSYFETQLVLDTMEALSRLGFQAYLAPYLPNGKPLHVHGFLKAFNNTARKNLDMLQRLSFYGLPFIGIDPSMTLTYRNEYTKSFGKSRQIPKIHLMQEWLMKKSEHLKKQPLACDHSTYYLLTHRTDNNHSSPAIQDWQEIYRILGLALSVQHIDFDDVEEMYLNESPHKETSIYGYDRTLKNTITKSRLLGKLVSTSYFNRSQVRQCYKLDISHPIQMLLKHLREANVD
ncbi:FAD-binding and (Fe-S)-binding domain-containing protein [Marinomonas profundimaris]|uniref:FAD-linked oxidase n=1 Tax=Marinomonas profundimaris TaxID=1208321 RepID=W1RSX6_9GAMM|nr:FAD-binding and (Fe-S)-binding domain-containing protein [Marinomonas profundimaris]ETI57963.1 FAD-linked oxidase [Marinomonas profundimaris]